MHALNRDDVLFPVHLSLDNAVDLSDDIDRELDELAPPVAISEMVSAVWLAN